MRKIAFILCILGMLCLLSILLFQSPKQISSPEELKNQIPNQLIKTSGLDTEERYTLNNKIIALNNDLKASCDLSCPNFLNKTVFIIGTYDDFYNQIKILEIKEIS